MRDSVKRPTQTNGKPTPGYIDPTTYPTPQVVQQVLLPSQSVFRRYRSAPFAFPSTMHGLSRLSVRAPLTLRAFGRTSRGPCHTPRLIPVQRVFRNTSSLSSLGNHHPTLGEGLPPVSSAPQTLLKAHCGILSFPHPCSFVSHPPSQHPFLPELIIAAVFP